ncbi:DTW-domain-containing protein [Neoconidiobolus thromboides FSU 785]|nr:DTW-domain-containing protein [Neoconidiobolus thromboides FSU 785]
MNLNKNQTVLDIAKNITNSDFLAPYYNAHDTTQSNETRTKCSTCNLSVKYYCYQCYKNIGEYQHLVPKLRLPLPLTIIKHPKELNSKSTGIHAKILATEDTEVINFPVDENQFDNPEECLLLFPSATATSIKDLKMEDNEMEIPYKRIVVIEGTWTQAKKIIKSSPSLTKMKAIKLDNNYSTIFWRYQQYDSSYLATIEAIYLIYFELIKKYKIQGNVDNLLFYYQFFYNLIQNYYNEPLVKEKVKYCHRHVKNYIKDKKLEENSKEEEE